MGKFWKKRIFDLIFVFFSFFHTWLRSKWVWIWRKSKNEENYWKIWRHFVWYPRMSYLSVGANFWSVNAQTFFLRWYILIKVDSWLSKRRRPFGQRYLLCFKKYGEKCQKIGSRQRKSEIYNHWSYENLWNWLKQRKQIKSQNCLILGRKRAWVGYSKERRRHFA